MKMTRKEKIEVLVENKELIRVGPDLYEDLGGHIIHESNDVIDDYYADFCDYQKKYREVDSEQV